MASGRQKQFYATGAVLILLFLFLLFVKYKDEFPISNHALEKQTAPKSLTATGKKTWKSIFLNGEKVGYAFSRISPAQPGYVSEEKMFLRLNAMGMVQNIDMQTLSRFNSDYTLNSFVLDIASGIFDFKASGEFKNQTLSIEVTGSGHTKGEPVDRHSIQLDEKPYLPSGILLDIFSSRWKRGDVFTYPLFDPVTMNVSPAQIELFGKERVTINGQEINAFGVSIQFKGMDQKLWVNQAGEVLLEKGFLGIKLISCPKKEALAGIPPMPETDITELAAVNTKKHIENQEELTVLRLKISGINLNSLALETHRQHLNGDILTIEKENLSGISNHIRQKDEFLGPSPFIQSEDPDLKQLALNITENSASPFEKAETLMAWVHENIEKTPVVTVPDAMATLRTRKGDCNEHAVLLAALARAAGVPSKVETGLFYLKGKFRYHAWNSFFLGKWITADAVFRQMPADVTHISLTSPEQGSEAELAGIIGKIKINILNFKKP